jgi:hypothetical protein
MKHAGRAAVSQINDCRNEQQKIKNRRTDKKEQAEFSFFKKYRVTNPRRINNQNPISSARINQKIT